MGIDDLIRQERERQARWDAAFAAAVALPKTELLTLVARLMSHIEGHVGVPKKPPVIGRPLKTPSIIPQADASEKKSFVAKAESFLEAHEEGVTTTQVADAIGQSVASADGTLRVLLKNRRALRVGGLWFPISVADESPVPPIQKKMTLRDYILAVFDTEKKPLGSLAIFEGLKKLKPDANRGSSDGEIVRMRKEGRLKIVGTGPNNGSLFSPVDADGKPLFKEATM